jgi:hypothetical protein
VAATHPLAATVLAGALVLVVPGTLCLLLARRFCTTSWIQRLAFGVAASWCIVTAACVVAFVFGLRVRECAAAFALGDVLLFGAWLWQRPWTRFERPRAAELALLAAILVIAVLAYRVGGYTDYENGPSVAPGWSTMEEPLQVSTVRKIEFSRRLRVDEVLYARGELATYYFPVYAFALAMVSWLSGLDPMILFDAFRVWTAALGLLAFAALAIASFGWRAGLIIMATALALVIGGIAGQASGSWGQLIPLTHIADFGLGVLLPLALFLVVRLCSIERAGIPAVAATIAFLFSMAITHTREAAHVASYMAALLVAGPIFGALDRRQWLRLAVTTIALVALVAAFSAFTEKRVPFIGEYEHAAAARARIEAAAALREPVRNWVSTADLPNVLEPYVTLGFLIAPFVLWVTRRNAGALMLTAGMIAWWVPMHIAVVGHLLERAVYSEVMMTPSRYVFHEAYLLYGVVVYGAILLVDRVDRGMRSVFAVLLAAVASVAVADAAQRLTDHPVVVFIAALAIAAIGIRLTRRTAPPWAFDPQRRFLQPVAAVACAAIVCAGVVVHSPHRTLVRTGNRRERARTADEATWYTQTAMKKALPWDAVAMLRSSVPARSVIAADPALGLSIPFAADQYLLVSGTNFTSDLHFLDVVERITGSGFDENAVDWNAYRARLGGDLAPAARADVVAWERFNQRLARLVALATAGAHAPLFGAAERPDVTMDLLDALHPDYILVSPTRHASLFELLSADPRRFGRVSSAGDFVLFKATRPALPLSTRARAAG